MATYTAEAAASCWKCGRQVWWKRVGESAATGRPVMRWCALPGSKPAPIDCPKGGYHDV